MSTLKDKVAIVTGAAQGIGKGIALELARNGAKVALWDVSREAVEAAAAELRAQGLQATAYVVDISSSKAVDAGFAEVEQAVGGRRRTGQQRGYQPSGHDPQDDR